ncbi:hypothetical protein [Rhodanobacter caeni]|uniref:Uncharacterized protein n=1 Tax=Rhodanobacter caeni TaxID=657654 RepID=A0ABN0UFB1_9GAMM
MNPVAAPRLRRLCGLALFAAFGAVAASAPPLPIASGQYTFRHRFAEQPDLPSISLAATIRGHHIVLVNRGESRVFPHGVVAKGTLVWNVAIRQWVIGTEPSDSTTPEAGGCSEGPEVVDLVKRIYWTC